MGWSVVTEDANIIKSGAFLHGVILLASLAGGDVTIYEGQDVGSGNKIVTVKGAANRSCPIVWRPPLECDRGIYVDVGSNVAEVHVHWSPQKPGEGEGV